MRLDDLRTELRQDPEYVAAERALRPLMDLADEILELRLERGWSQAELADRVGTKQANISRIESGLGNPTFKFLQKLAAAFGTELAIHVKPQQSVERTRVVYGNSVAPQLALSTIRETDDEALAAGAGEQEYA
jgi:transcriptional regulator with XRE-family HTH domain